jgi:hypothetical protein
VTTDAGHQSTELARCRATLDRADWAAYQRHARRHATAGLTTYSWALMIVISLAAALLGLGLEIRNDAAFHEPSAGDVLVPVALVVLGIWLVAVVIVNSRIRRRWYGQPVGPLELTADSGGATVQRSGQSTRFTWESALAWSEDGDRIYVSIAPGVGWPFPKRDFRSAEDLDRLRMVLRDVGAPRR